jgi:hypothetical protein
MYLLPLRMKSVVENKHSHRSVAGSDRLTGGKKSASQNHLPSGHSASHTPHRKDSGEHAAQKKAFRPPKGKNVNPSPEP